MGFGAFRIGGLIVHWYPSHDPHEEKQLGTSVFELDKVPWHIMPLIIIGGTISGVILHYIIKKRII